ncbi:MAG: 16S rRNA (cytidine(1402)-2'-O)-methyltransferase [Gemmatimonadales bacterium]
MATPLGNLGDLSERALQVLRDVEIVAAEDTRRARVLLERAEAAPRMLSFHAHSPPSRLDQLLNALVDGAAVALITDAGTPGVSDPGFDLVRRAQEEGVQVVAIPGPSAVSAALSISGLPAGRYTFLGFLPRKGKDRQKLIDTVAGAPWTVVIFEAANRLVKLLGDLVDACGADRTAVAARELTKVHEEVKRGTLRDLQVYYQMHPPRGEVTVCVSGAEPTNVDVDEAEVRERALDLLSHGVTRRDASAKVAAEFAIPRRDAYRMITNL